MKDPLVTIGITNYNYGHFIRTALESVVKQTYKNIELIIVDDCSTDSSVITIENWISNNSKKLPIIFIRNKKNRGLTASSNVILENANGKYLQLLDADDFLLPEKVKKQVEMFKDFPDGALVYCNLRVEDINGNLLDPDYCHWIKYDRYNMPEGRVLDELILFNFIPAHAPIFSVAYAKELGGFDTSLQLQDYYMWLKLAETYEFRFLNEVLGIYRIHNSSMSGNIKTYPTSADSALTLKYRYYNLTTKKNQKKIAENIHFGSVYLYEQKFYTAKKWLTIAFKLKPSFKTFVYFISIRIGVPFSFYKGLKKYFLYLFKVSKS
jgi:glycosyltransferase involved in cell wall biosynthesis